MRFLGVILVLVGIFFVFAMFTADSGETKGAGVCCSVVGIGLIFGGIATFKEGEGLANRNH